MCRKPVKDVVSVHRAIAMWEQSSQVQILPPGPILNRYLAALSSQVGIQVRSRYVVLQPTSPMT